MAQVYFHCSHADGILVDRCGAMVDDLADACEQADVVVQSFIMAPSVEDWRGWVLHVSDELGEELFSVPFASRLGKPH